MAREYVTTERVKDLVGIELPAATAHRTIRRASRDVDSMLLGANYDVDERGMPTDPEVVELFEEATAEQIAWFDELGDETGVAGVMGGSIGNVSLPQVQGGGAVQAPAVVKLLRGSGVLDWRVRY